MWFSRVCTTDSDFIYIFMSGYYQNFKNIGCYPDWARRYYFSNKIFDTHRQFFDGFDGDDTSLQLRRAAFRKSIGEKDVSIKAHEENISLPNETFLNGVHGTKLMKIQKKVLNCFYGDQFDVNDRDTWTNQNVVVDWLTTEFKLSKREAEAIDMVTRPDLARGK
tara:strand:- start:533 stop:1024 length:492 start_codon:yes stop_codon:yes gene_type:complete